MNEHTTSEMTVSRLLALGLIASIALPVALILILAVFGRLASDANVFELVALLCALTVVLGVFIVNYMIRRKIDERLLFLGEVCRAYAGGDRAVRAPVSGDDAFATLSMALNSLLERGGFPSGGTSTASQGSDAAALQAQIEKLLQEVSAVGDGDLSVQAEVTPDTLGVLADSFNYMIEELAKVVGRVQATAVQVTHAARRILDRSAELAQASETQVAQISQTTQAVEDLAIFIQNVARNAQLSAEAAQEALSNANVGQQAVRQSIEGMGVIRENVQETQKKIKRLGERSNEIGEIVRIIEDIADQTNLLALNAAIQSAMAGEHGRGFAVVADEIRLLAERSTESTKQIATLVKSIQGDTFEAVVAMEDSTQEVVKGSQLADDAGRALNSIFAAVERQARMIEGIARAANEQTAVSEHVAVAMAQISEITRQTNTATQEASVSVSYLSELADELRTSVSTFRLPDHQNEMVEVFPGMPGGTPLVVSMQQVPALPGANANATYAQEGEWNAGFSGDFMPLMPASPPEEAGSFVQFDFGDAAQGNAWQAAANSGPELWMEAGSAYSNAQEFANQPGYAGQQWYGNQQMSETDANNAAHLYSSRHLPSTNVPQPSHRMDEQHKPFAGQYSSQPGFSGQPQPNSQPGFSGQPQYSNLPTNAGQPPYGSQPGYSGQPPYGSQPGFSGQRHAGSQPGAPGQQYSFDGGSRFEHPQQPSGQQQFGTSSGFGTPSSPLFPTSLNSAAIPQPTGLPQQNTGPVQQGSGEIPLSRNRQRWGNAQQFPSQPSFGQNRQNQEQFPSDENGNGNR